MHPSRPEECPQWFTKEQVDLLEAPQGWAEAEERGHSKSKVLALEMRSTCQRQPVSLHEDKPTGAARGQRQGEWQRHRGSWGP